VATTKKSAKPPAKDSEVSLDFSTPPKEWLHFNHFWVEKRGDFISIYLGYLDESGQLSVFFKGMQWQPDLEGQRVDLEKYIERIGAPKADAVSPKHPSYNLTRIPVPINTLGCASRATWGEISILQFSHKDVVSKLKHPEDDAKVRGVVHGCYISDIEIHKQLIYEILTAKSNP